MKAEVLFKGDTNPTVYEVDFVDHRNPNFLRVKLSKGGELYFPKQFVTKVETNA